MNSERAAMLDPQDTAARHAAQRDALRHGDQVEQPEDTIPLWRQFTKTKRRHSSHVIWVCHIWQVDPLMGKLLDGVRDPKEATRIISTGSIGKLLCGTPIKIKQVLAATPMRSTPSVNFDHPETGWRMIETPWKWRGDFAEMFRMRDNPDIPESARRKTANEPCPICLHWLDRESLGDSLRNELERQSERFLDWLIDRGWP